MARNNSTNGLGNLLGLLIIIAVVGSVAYSARDTSTPAEPQPVEQPETVQTPQKNTSEQIIEKLGIGDGTLGAAKSVSASDLGKATSVSGGGFTVKSSGSSGRRSASTSTPSTPTRSGG